MASVFRFSGFLLLAGAIALGLGACGRKGPLEPPPYAAVDPATTAPEGAAIPPGAPGAAARAAGGPLAGWDGPAQPYGVADNPSWNPTADRSAGVNGATTREVANAPAARERSVLDWLVN